MELLYSDQSFRSVDRRLKWRVAVLCAVCTVLLGVFLAMMIIRNNWAAVAAAAAAGFFAIFFTDLLCMPLVRYRRLIRSALSGRSHEKTLEFDHTEPDTSSVEGVTCRSLIFLGDPDKHGSREMLLYWDCELALPELSPGSFYTVKYTGKHIIGIRQEAASSRP